MRQMIAAAIFSGAVVAFAVAEAAGGARDEAPTVGAVVASADVAKQAGVGPALVVPAFSYLESLKGQAQYLAPSEIDPRYTIALYVNISGKGANAQRMWMMQRDPKSGKFKLAMWDEDYWEKTGPVLGLQSGQTPPYSWLISSGYKWRNVRRSGPTPVGVFAIDERPGRMNKGWVRHDIKHIMYIDLHYRSGRKSGVAFHGVPKHEYKKFGTIASHGCIRMTQSNALALMSRMRGWDGALTKDQRWGEVPRYWKYQSRGVRRGYLRDGAVFDKRTKKRLRVGTIATDTTALPNVLTKTGYRAVAIFFKDDASAAVAPAHIAVQEQ